VSVSKGRKCLEAYNISLDRNKKTNRREQFKMILVCCLLQSRRGLLLPFCSIWVQAGVAQRRGVLGQNSLLPARVFALGIRNGRPVFILFNLVEGNNSQYLLSIHPVRPQFPYICSSPAQPLVTRYLAAPEATN
jgi:hypothetical protein